MKVSGQGVRIEEEAMLAKMREAGAYLVEGHVPLYEALYFTEKGVLAADKEAIWKQLKKRDKQAEIRYLVFSFLWNRGYITRESLDGGLFRIHRKGIRIGEDRTENVMRIIKAGEKYDRKRMEQDLEVAGSLRKQLVLAVVDGQNVQFIKISRTRFD